MALFIFCNLLKINTLPFHSFYFQTLICAVIKMISELVDSFVLRNQPERQALSVVL